MSSFVLGIEFGESVELNIGSGVGVGGVGSDFGSNGGVCLGFGTSGFGESVSLTLAHAAAIKGNVAIGVDKVTHHLKFFCSY